MKVCVFRARVRSNGYLWFIRGEHGLNFFSHRFVFRSLGRVPTWCVPSVSGDKLLSNQEFLGSAEVECNLTTLRSFVVTAADLWRTNLRL